MGKSKVLYGKRMFVQTIRSYISDLRRDPVLQHYYYYYTINDRNHFVTNAQCVKQYIFIRTSHLYSTSKDDYMLDVRSP